MGNDLNGWLQLLAWYLRIMQVFCDNFGLVPQGSPDKKEWHCIIRLTLFNCRNRDQTHDNIYIYMIISLQALYLSMFIYFILSQHMRHMRSYEHVRDLDQPKIHSSMCSAPPWTSVLTEAILTLPDVSMVRVPNWNASRSRHGYR